MYLSKLTIYFEKTINSDNYIFSYMTILYTNDTISHTMYEFTNLNAVSNIL